MVTGGPGPTGETLGWVQLRRDPLGRVNVVLLDRVDDLPKQLTPYCVHGRTRCIACGAWCWLGDRSHDAVKAGTAPICRPCAAARIPAGTPTAGNLADHRRADGPH